MLFVTGLEISIHAPARGATQDSRVNISIKEDFNPRSREGSDLRKAGLGWIRVISIHAPARGATVQSISNPEQHAGFQSTLPRGERRRSPQGDRRYLRYFNPRSREGSDSKYN